MNCKPGDLAVIVRSMAGNDGKLVRVICANPGNPRSPGAEYQTPDGIIWRRTGSGFFWFCESLSGPLVNHNGFAAMRRPVPDAILRPIRDPGEDAKDETLNWLPVPSREKEAA